MNSVTDRLNKLREERIAREKARLDKLRELNLKKYNTYGDPYKNSTSYLCNKAAGAVSKDFNVNSTMKRPALVPTTKTTVNKGLTKPQSVDVTKTRGTFSNSNIPKGNHTNLTNIDKKNSTVANPDKKLAHNVAKVDKKPASAINADKRLKMNDKKLPNTDRTVTHISHLPKSEKKVVNGNVNVENKQNFAIRKTDSATTSLKLRQSLAVTNDKPKLNMARKSMIPQSSSQTSSQCSVFERLSKPKHTHSHINDGKKPHTDINDVKKLHTDPHYLRKVIRNSGIILNKRHTVFDHNEKIVPVPVRRSISAVHFKRIGKQELGNCIHKWSSIGDKLNNVHLKHINEDENVKADRVVSAVKSERKKVTFMSPIPYFNTPKPEELQARLKSWLQKRGKSLDSYNHLQCFGVHHLPHSIKFDARVFDEEDKENIAVDSDSDDGSYMENMNDELHEIQVTTEKWRNVSSVSDSVDFNESQNTTTTCSDVINLDEVVHGALNDLTELLRDGFDWEQCARWLRAIRERFPSAPHTAAYWECRAALEERRGDLPASVQCWEEAIAKGTEHSVVEANLDQLLDKFMQLKISPNSGKQRQADPKLVDVKNVFKSTIIRFAVQQAKLRQSNQSEAPKYTITPVRRSARVKYQWDGRRTPLQVCTTVRQADELLGGEKPVFVPNGSLYDTP